MVQEYYSLEEAARALGVGPEELKQMAQKRDVRAFSDRGTWKFRKQDIEEAARRRGAGSSAEIPLAGLKSEGDLINFDVADLGLESSIKPSPVQSGSGITPPHFDEGADQILLSDESFNAPGASRLGGSTIIGMDVAPGKPPSDSDVKLVPGGGGKGPSDSDIRMVTGGSKSDSDVKLVGSSIAASPSDSDVRLVGSSIEVDPRTGSSPGDTKIGMEKPPAAKGKPPKDESDFDLGPLDSSVRTARSGGIGLGDTPLPGELSPGHRDEPEIFLGSPTDSDVTASLASASGINLGSPADSGISLESPPDIGGISSNIGLAPLDEDTSKPQAKKPPTVAKPAKPVTGVRPEPKGPGASDSGKDIFETDFEVPVIEDTDETMQLEAGSSDFELSSHPDADSASQVFALDEDASAVDSATKTALGSGIVTVDEDEDVAASSSGFGSSASGIMEDLEEPATSSAAIPVSGGLVTTRPEAEWSGLWVGLLAFGTILNMLIAFVMFDLVHNMWTWHGDYPIAGSLIQTFASWLGLTK